MRLNILPPKRKNWTVYINESARWKITQMSIETNRRIGDLLEEAIEIFVIDHKSKKEYNET